MWPPLLQLTKSYYLSGFQWILLQWNVYFQLSLSICTAGRLHRGVLTETSDNHKVDASNFSLDSEEMNKVGAKGYEKKCWIMSLLEVKEQIQLLIAKIGYQLLQRYMCNSKLYKSIRFIGARAFISNGTRPSLSKNNIWRVCDGLRIFRVEMNFIRFIMRNVWSKELFTHEPTQESCKGSRYLHELRKWYSCFPCLLISSKMTSFTAPKWKLYCTLKLQEGSTNALCQGGDRK